MGDTMGRRFGSKNQYSSALPRLLTRQQQRTKEARAMMLAAGLWAHLHNLVEAIVKESDTTALADFQQYIQYAPPQMKEEILLKLEALRTPDDIR